MQSIRNFFNSLLPASKGEYTHVDQAAAGKGPETAAGLVDEKHYDFEGAKTKIDSLWGKYSTIKNQTNLKAIKQAVKTFNEQLQKEKTKPKPIGLLSTQSTEAKMDTANQNSLNDLSQYVSNQNLLLQSADEEFTGARDAKLGCCSYLTYCLPAHLFIPDALPNSGSLDADDAELPDHTTTTGTTLPVAQPVDQSKMRGVRRVNSFNGTAAATTTVTVASTASKPKVASAVVASTAGTTNDDDMFGNSDDDAPLVMDGGSTDSTKVAAPKPKKAMTNRLFIGANNTTVLTPSDAEIEAMNSLTDGLPGNDGEDANATNTSNPPAPAASMV